MEQKRAFAFLALLKQNIKLRNLVQKISIQSLSSTQTNKRKSVGCKNGNCTFVISCNKKKCESSYNKICRTTYMQYMS